MNPKLLLKVFPVVLLMVMGMGGVARSETVVQPPANQGQAIDQLIQQLIS
jgi:hypothetical protein